ncbi:hypothetical protein MXB_4824, partial [Myxobolus squamalis]
SKAFNGRTYLKLGKNEEIKIIQQEIKCDSKLIEMNIKTNLFQIKIQFDNCDSGWNFTNLDILLDAKFQPSYGKTRELRFRASNLLEIPTPFNSFLCTDNVRYTLKRITETTDNAAIRMYMVVENLFVIPLPNFLLDHKLS